MRRREFIALASSAAVGWSPSVRAQKVARIGWLQGATDVQVEAREQALRAGLHDLGYVEGKNYVFEFRRPKSADQLPDLAAELVRKNVDIIFAAASAAVAAAKQATTTIPIVFAAHGDPVGTGHVKSLAQPGGNITGLSMLLTDLAIKELEILKEGMPQATRIGVLWNPTTPSNPPALRAVEAASEKLRVQVLGVPVRTEQDFENALSTMTRERVDSFLVIASPLTNWGRPSLAELALKHRLPGMFGIRESVYAGGLISYGADINNLFRRAAIYIDKILKGAKPADLPVEQASKYELVINLKTAKTLGLMIPVALLARADEVIE
jgi:putative ABC transport system substrate-binding protein